MEEEVYSFKHSIIIQNFDKNNKWFVRFELARDAIGDYVLFNEIGAMRRYYYDKDLLLSDWGNFNNIFSYSYIHNGEYKNNYLVFYNNEYYILGRLSRFYHSHGSTGNYSGHKEFSYMEINITGNEENKIIKTEIGFKNFLNKINATKIKL